MPVRCQVTGKKPGYGNKVSHSNKRTGGAGCPTSNNAATGCPPKPLDRLRLSTKAMKTIDKRGIESVVAEMRARGERV